jgi:hypothetical protein
MILAELPNLLATAVISISLFGAVTSYSPKV